MATYPLDTAATVVLDANGNGSVQIGPTKPFENWRVTNLAVSVSTNAIEPTAKVYKGPSSARNLIAGTYTGSNDSTTLDTDLRTGEVITVEWTNGDPGSIATVSISGKIDTPR